MHVCARGAALWVAAWCAPACTEPSFALGDAAQHEEPSDAAVAPDDGDEPRADASHVDAVAAAPTKDGGAYCDACSIDANAAPSARDAEQDAPEAGTAPRDAEAVVSDAGLDPLRAKWVGRYAARSFVFGYSNPYKTYARYLTLVQIKPTPEGGLSLEEEICRFESSFSLLAITAHFAVDYPAGTSLRAPLTFDAESFSSAPASAMVGHGPAPADCAGAATSRSASPPRPWLTDNVCECPRDLSALPTQAKDCRVIDQDGDGLPGNTFRGTLIGSVGVTRVTQEQRLRLLNGYRVGERLFAQREFSDVTSVLSCTIDGMASRIEDCALGTAGPCPAKFQPVELYPIGAQYGCSDVIQREAGWFIAPQPEFPAGCQ